MKATDYIWKRTVLAALCLLMAILPAAAQNEADWKALEKPLNFYLANDLGRNGYYDQKPIAELMGRMAAAEFAAHGFFDGVDAIVPVPLARKRMRERGYNQAFEIARGISAVTRMPIIDKAVIRESFKRSQTKMNRWQRNENVEGVFSLVDGSALTGKHILIIDDVVTTGATVVSCARELMKAGDVRFSVMSLGFTKG